MLKNILRSGLKMQAPATRYYVYGQHGRAFMGNPEPNDVPKDIYQYQYAFDNYPDSFNSFKYVHHDKYVLHQTFSFENFDFRYEGEQWHIGSLFCNALCLAFPFILYFWRKYENITAKYRKGTRTVHYNTQAGFLGDTLHIYDQNPL